MVVAPARGDLSSIPSGGDGGGADDPFDGPRVVDDEVEGGGRRR